MLLPGCLRSTAQRVVQAAAEPVPTHNWCRGYSRSQLYGPARVGIAVKGKFEAHQRRLAEELNQALLLFGPLKQPVEVLTAHNDHGVFALPGDDLGTFFTSFAKKLAEAGFGALQLPFTGVGRGFQGHT